MKSINSQTNESSGLTAELYKHCSNELAPILLDFLTPQEKLCTMGVTSRTGIISVIYQKDDQKYCKLQTQILQF